MSDETKNTTVQEAQPEQTATSRAQAAPKSGTKAKGKADAKGKNETKPKTGTDTGGTLKSVGLDACKRHGIAEVWVTADGQSFARQGDAGAHAANLNDKQILNVKAE